MGKKNQTNLNLLINQILTKNVQWDEHTTKMGWLQFDPKMVKKIFEHLDKNGINDIAKSIKTDIINVIKFIYLDTSLEHIVEFIESWLRSTNSQFRYVEDSESHKFLVNHTIGKNWSIFAMKSTEEFVTELGYIITDVVVNTNSYSYTIVK